jgi:hypothetical protein
MARGGRGGAAIVATPVADAPAADAPVTGTAGTVPIAPHSLHFTRLPADVSATLNRF